MEKCHHRNLKFKTGGRQASAKKQRSIMSRTRIADSMGTGTEKSRFFKYYYDKKEDDPIELDGFE